MDDAAIVALVWERSENAIREAEKNLDTCDLSGCVLYTTAEPCPMCLFACLLADIDRVYYGAAAEDIVTIGFRNRESDGVIGLNGLPEDYLACIDRDACLSLFQIYADNLQSSK